MSTTRLHPHHSLPAPVVHAGFSVSQSKSYVLAGVQDAYWSDDETEDAECPLCLEEMDISDLNFKPCICGYQICRFCWHHIKENLNKRCPACRRIYTDDAVEFKPIATQDHKRLMQQKKQRDRERKELESLGRRHLANVRVVQRNVVYVVGIGPRFAKEELIPTLRSNEYFGQYGKITKILLVKRNSPGGGGPVVGLYITYHRREDAARAIAAVDGTSSPGGGREVMRASYGTTKYCMTFLRGVSCSDHSCMNLHEWGDEKDCFTKEDLTTLKHTMKATESRTRTITAKKGDEDVPLPRAASWGQKGVNNSSAAAGSSSSATSNAISRQSRRMGNTRQPRNVASTVGHSEPRYSQGKSILERKIATSSVSRPSTPATSEASRTEISNDTKTAKQKEVTTPAPQAVDSPAASTSNLDLGSTVPETIPLERPESTDSSELKPQPTTSKPTVPNPLSPPPGLPAPPGLSAPPGISSPSRPPRAETASPQTPLLASQSSYQMSTAARALLDDVKARRESTLPLAPAFSPFPDFDRTLQTLSGDDGGGFSFNLDPKLADEADSTAALEFNVTSSAPFHGSYIDAFPALRSGSPYGPSPAIGHGHGPHPSIYDPALLRPSSGHQSEKQASRGPAYSGSFNPFSDAMVESTALSSPQRMPSSPVDEERKVSRFGFARGRQSSTAASPLHSVSPLAYSGDHHNFCNPTEETSANALHAWSQNLQAPNSLSNSPVSQPAPARTHFQQPQQNRLQPTTNELSEAQLRNFIISSQERTNGLRGSADQQHLQYMSSQPFEDPAIMSASFSASTNDQVFASMAYGPPPGLQRPTPPSMMHTQVANVAVDGRSNSAQVSAWTSTTAATLLSPEDFPALVPSSPDPPVAANTQDSTNLLAPFAVTGKDREKAERKAVRKDAAAEKALEKQRLAQGKAEAKAAEKAKVIRDKQSEKEKAEKEKNTGPHSAPTAKDARVVEPVPNPLVAVPSKLTKKPSRQESQNEKPTTSKKTSPKTSDSFPTNKRQDSISSPAKTKPTPPVKSTNSPVDDITTQVPLLSKKPKKNKAIVKPVKVVKEEETHEEPLPSVSDAGRPHGPTTTSSSANSRSHSVDHHQAPTSVHRLLEQIDAVTPGLDLCNHPFFNIQRLTSPAKVPLEYGPLVHALSALSVGGGSFANNMPSGSIDNAVSSFQQLLETLTQTISDLLRLLPRTTWDDSSSFDGVLRDMLKGDDFLDDGGEDGPGKEDEVAALTLALERRARWMEVQLSKLEELHRDINTAAVRAVLSFNDSGWDRSGFLPRVGNTLNRFNSIGMVVQDGELRPMTADELEKKLAVAEEAAVFAETELREAMEKYHNFKSSSS